jgi:hypothetical protein
MYVPTCSASYEWANTTLLGDTTSYRIPTSCTTTTAYPSWVKSSTATWGTTCCEATTGTRIAWADTQYLVLETNVVPKTPAQKLQDILRLRASPAIIVPSRQPIRSTVDVREIRARDTLRCLLGENDFKLFLRNGFVSIRGQSGRVYQVYPGHKLTKVYERGKLIEELCVIISGDYCPTDSILMRYVMLLHDEEHFRHLANKRQPTKPNGLSIIPAHSQPLPEIFANLKRNAA